MLYKGLINLLLSFGFIGMKTVLNKNIVYLLRVDGVALLDVLMEFRKILINVWVE